MENVREWIEMAALLIETMAVVIMVAFIIIETFKWLVIRRNVEEAYTRYRRGLGKILLVGLELLVAADIIRTVALNATLYSIATLSALVIVRTFLGWSLTVEIEGRWPWEKKISESGAE